jgi:glycerol uptake facilitator-like aquaporin
MNLFEFSAVLVGLIYALTTKENLPSAPLGVFLLVIILATRESSVLIPPLDVSIFLVM